MAFTRGQINFDAIASKAIRSQRVSEALQKKVKEKFEKNKTDLLAEFRESAVTKEIRGGAGSANISATLGGYGNLFSYIGFYSGEDPIAPIEQYLREFRFSGKVINTKYSKGQISISYLIKWYDLETIMSLSPMPWESANSWIKGIEKGISGFSYYMYGEFMKGRSKKGLQSKAKVNLAPTFSPRRYLPAMIEKFKSKF